MQHNGQDFRSPATPRSILSNGSREQIIQWLAWNDPNGVWSDADSAAEGWMPITLEQARASMRAAVGIAADGNRLEYSEPIEFDPHLPHGADEEKCQEWLRKICREFGLGFHPDTPASDFRNWDGLPLHPDVAAAIDDSVDRAFEILGEELLYTVCAEVAETTLAGLVARSESHPGQTNGHCADEQQ